MAASTTTPPIATFDSGRMAVPTSLTPVTASTVDLMGCHFANPTSAAINITVTDTAGLQVVPTVEVPANLDIPREYALMPTIGLKWQASGAGLVGQMWGFLRA